MKKRFLLLLTLISWAIGMTAQSSLTYAIGYPMVGPSSLQLVEFDLVAGTETVIKTYLTSEIEDIYGDPGSTFDHQNNRIITPGEIAGNESIIAINASSGNIDYSYTPSIEIVALEAAGALTVSLHEARNLIPFFEVYPNPAENQFGIDCEIAISSIYFMNITGSVCKSFESNLTNLDVSNISPGIYFVRVNSKKGATTRKLIIK